MCKGTSCRFGQKMAAGGEVVAKYIGHKIAKTRWSPSQQGSILSSDTFATGGWDDEVSFFVKRFSNVSLFTYFDLILLDRYDLYFDTIKKLKLKSLCVLNISLT
jgi:hypothetical protein